MCWCWCAGVYLFFSRIFTLFLSHSSAIVVTFGTCSVYRNDKFQIFFRYLDIKCIAWQYRFDVTCLSFDMNVWFGLVFNPLNIYIPPGGKIQTYLTLFCECRLWFVLLSTQKQCQRKSTKAIDLTSITHSITMIFCFNILFFQSIFFLSLLLAPNLQYFLLEPWSIRLN